MAASQELQNRARIAFGRSAGREFVDLLDASVPDTSLDDVTYSYGTDDDTVLVNRSSSLTANTALTGVLVGTPAVAAIPANSLIVSTVTADGDQVFATVPAGGSNSIEWVRNDASAGLTVFNEQGADIDHRFEGDTNTNMHVIDAGTDSQAFGSAVVSGAALSISNLTGRATVTSVGVQLHSPAATFNDTAGAATIAIMADHFFGIRTHTATNARVYTDAATIYVAGAPTASTNVTQTSSYALFVDAGVTRLDGTTYIGDSSNADVTLGLTINQAGNDDQIFALKSSDVAHGVTTLAETDSYLTIKKNAATEGAPLVQGFGTAQQGFVIYGVGTTADTTDAPTTTSEAIVEVRTALANGTGVQASGATGNIFQVMNTTTNEFIVKGDGEIYSNQSATVGTFDALHDTLACADLSYVLSNEYEKITTYGREMFRQLGILADNPDGSPGMYSVTKMMMLVLCGLGQAGRQIDAICQKIGLDLNALPGGINGVPGKIGVNE